MTHETELKKCPFCGATAHPLAAMNDKICVVCMGCGIGTQPERDFDAAMKTWNKRVWGGRR